MVYSDNFIIIYSMEKYFNLGTQQLQMSKSNSKEVENDILTDLSIMTSGCLQTQIRISSQHCHSTPTIYDLYMPILYLDLCDPEAIKETAWGSEHGSMKQRSAFFFC